LQLERKNIMAKHPPVTHLQNTGHSWLEPKGSDDPYVHQEYPKTKHHETKASVVVHDPAEEAALGKEYADSPAAFTPEGKKAAAEKAEKEAAAAKAAAPPPPAK
jgi:hypothetical protein